MKIIVTGHGGSTLGTIEDASQLDLDDLLEAFGNNSKSYIKIVEDLFNDGFDNMKVVGESVLFIPKTAIASIEVQVKQDEK